MVSSQSSTFSQTIQRNTLRSPALRMSPSFRTISTIWQGGLIRGFHPEKCNALTIGKQQTQIAKKYTLNENELVNISEEKDFGVIIDNKLKFEDHIGEKEKKTNLIAGLIHNVAIQGGFNNLDFKLFETLYIVCLTPSRARFSSMVSLSKETRQFDRQHCRGERQKRVQGFKNHPTRRGFGVCSYQR